MRVAHLTVPIVDIVYEEIAQMYKLCKALIVIWSGFCGLGLIAGLGNVSSIQTTNQFEQAGANIGIALGVGYWITLWFLPTVALGIIALVTRPRTNYTQVLPKPTLCPHCGKYYAGFPAYCPNCGRQLRTYQP
jgi:hypothetical protein